MISAPFNKLLHMKRLMSYDRSDNSIGSNMGELSMSEPERDRNEQSDDDTKRNDEVWTRRSIHRFSKSSPRNSLEKEKKKGEELKKMLPDEMMNRNLPKSYKFELVVLTKCYFLALIGKYLDVVK
jgi:hypothetical protein